MSGFMLFVYAGPLRKARRAMRPQGARGYCSGMGEPSAYTFLRDAQAAGPPCVPFKPAAESDAYASMPETALYLEDGRQICYDAQSVPMSCHCVGRLSLPRQGHWFSLCCSLATPLGSATAESDFLSSATACAPLISPEEPLMSDFVHLHCHTEYSLLGRARSASRISAPAPRITVCPPAPSPITATCSARPIFTLPARTSASSHIRLRGLRLP